MIKKAVLMIILCLWVAGCSRTNTQAQSHHGFMKGRWVPMKKPQQQSKLSLPGHVKGPAGESAAVTVS